MGFYCKKIKKGEKIMEHLRKNEVVLSGRIATSPTFSHEVVGGEKFYEFILDVRRLSGTVDSLPITISERLMQSVNFTDFSVGDMIKLSGDFRSYNKDVEGKSKLILSVFCKLVEPKTEEIDINQIDLTGYVCKSPEFRTTPLKRQIKDLLLAVNRLNKKSDYIPIIIWGRNATVAKNYKVGDCVSIKGRIQSRKYNKLIGNDLEERTAYEVSVQEVYDYIPKIEKHLIFDEEKAYSSPFNIARG